MIQIELDKRYEINAEAEYPQFFATISLSTGHPKDRILKLWAEIKLSYNHEHSNYNINWNVELPAQTGEQRFQILPNPLSGGRISLIGFVKVKGYLNGRTEIFRKEMETVDIIAKQPSKQKIREYYPNLEFQVLTYYFSRFLQFTPDGQPNYNDGFGLSKLKQPTVEELWNWKTNLLNLRDQFSQRFDEASRYPAFLRESQPDVYGDLPDFDDDQIYIEVYQSFGQGKYFKPIRNADSGLWQWVKNEDCDNFAYPILQILKAAQIGNFPEDWNDASGV